jgi:hypothetical protein
MAAFKLVRLLRSAVLYHSRNLISVLLALSIRVSTAGKYTYLFTANKRVILPDLHQSVLGKSLSNELFKPRLRNIVDHLSKPGQLKTC